MTTEEIWLTYRLTEKKNQVTIYLKCAFNRILCSIQISDLRRNMMLAALMEAIIDNVEIWLGTKVFASLQQISSEGIY